MIPERTRLQMKRYSSCFAFQRLPAPQILHYFSSFLFLFCELTVVLEAWGHQISAGSAVAKKWYHAKWKKWATAGHTLHDSVSMLYFYACPIGYSIWAFVICVWFLLLGAFLGISSHSTILFWATFSPHRNRQISLINPPETFFLSAQGSLSVAFFFSIHSWNSHPSAYITQ